MTETQGSIQLSNWSKKLTANLDPEHEHLYRSFLSHFDNENDFKDQDPQSEIGQFYENKTIFITGASGFVGSVVVEKLLRSCPKLKQIYILMRPKRGISIEKRLKAMLEATLFDRIRGLPEADEILSKVKPIKGEITQHLLGITRDDILELANSVNIIINSAASVKFDSPIEHATLYNVLSVDNLFNFAKKMSQLEVLVHISTCFANCNLQEVEEEYYKSPIEPEELMDLAQNLNDEDRIMLDRLVALHDRPNTYTFTKAVAEDLFKKRSKELNSTVQTCIVRPSIVIASWREPIRGYINDVSSATVVIVSISGGWVMALPADPAKCVDLTPVDMTANLIVSCPWALKERGQIFPSGCIFSASGMPNKIQWKAVMDHFQQLALKYPLDMAVRAPDKILIPSKILFEVISYFDWLYLKVIFFIMGLIKNPESVARIQTFCIKARKVNKFLRYFMIREWDFRNDRTNRLYKELSDIDKDIFNFDVTQLNWADYLDSYYCGSKIFALKDSPDKLMISRRRMEMIMRNTRIFYAIVSLVLMMIPCYYLISWL